MMRGAVQPLALDALGGTALFRATMAGRPEATSLYRRDPWSATDLASAAAEAAAHARHRDAVADVLAEQNRAWGADAHALALVERLRDPASVAVVTGQQLGLFAGPLYTVYKAMAAVRWAARIAAETGRPAVPVFWLADEDHDFAEIRGATFSDGATVGRAAYDDGRPPGDNRGPVGRLVLDGAATAGALADLERLLPAGPHRAEALALAREAYAPGRTMRDAFVQVLRALAPGLVLISADDARLKRLAAPLFTREVERYAETLAALDARSADLRARGFHVQVEPTPVNLFWIADDGRRLPIDPDPADADAFVLRGTTERFARADFLARIAAQPERVSPNVVLRPVQQDTLLPTAAYIAGPGEAAYFAQLAPVYDLFGVPMPAILPRLSATLVEPGVAKVLDRYGLAVPDLRGDLHPLWRRLAADAAGLDLDAPFDAAAARARALLDDLRAPVTATDASLDAALGAAGAAVEKALARLRTQTVRVQKRRHADVHDRLARAQAALYPGGALQERALSPLQVMARHGAAFLPDLLGTLDLDAPVHHIVRV
jgi:bacillithiol biosynthesis cysteine-adding enzyme BshC